MPPRVLILRAPGTNCDVETAYAFELAGATTERMHLNRLLEKPALAGDFQVLCIPGGFSFGDDIAAGRVFAVKLHRGLADVLRQFREDGKLILGICNGLQVLCKSGLLLDDADDLASTLTWNDSGRFEDRWTLLKADGELCVFLRGVEQMELPIAHAEGKYVVGDDALFDRLAAAGQFPLRYASHNGGEPTYPANPNGSKGHIAGVCDATGRVFGLMPHPERHLDFTHHPQWTRRETKPAGDGLAVFQNAVQYFA